MAILGLGTAALGRPSYINLREKHPEEPFILDRFREQGIRLLNTAYALGVRYYDTAPGYGVAESLLIQWLGQKEDASIKVSSKWGYTYTANFDPNATIHEVKEHSLNKLNEQWEVSRKLLSFLKTYQIHSATLETGVLENIEILDRLDGLKREYGLQIGLTTTGVNHVEVLRRALDVQVNGEPLFSSCQCTFNILDGSLLQLKPLLQERKIQLILKEVLANGRLIPNDIYGNYESLYKTLDRLGARYQVGPDAIALRFAMDSFPDAIVLSGAQTEEHLKSNLKANALQLDDTEWEELTAYAITPKSYWEERKQMAWN